MRNNFNLIHFHYLKVNIHINFGEISVNFYDETSNLKMYCIGF